MKLKKFNKFNKTVALYSGLTDDLFFWVAINSLFLTIVKNFTVAQIVSLTSISMLVSIILQIPILKIIQKLGNTYSVRVGQFLMLVSSILLTFGPNYLIVVLGKIIYEIAYSFRNMIDATLKNNLELQGKSENYIKIKTQASSIYAFATMIISIIASFMFNLNHYLPMICCIAFCLLGFVMSFYMIDFSNYDKVEVKKVKKTKVKYNKIVIVLLISYALCYPIINAGQENGQLFIQQELLQSFSVEKTSLILGGILFISRIVRFIANLLFDKIYEKYQDKAGVMVTILLSISVVAMMVGSLISVSLPLKFIVMAIGYLIILFIRDPFRNYMQDVGLKNVTKAQQQILLTTMDLLRKITRIIISFLFAMLLVKHSMLLIMGILVVLSILEILVSIKLYRLLVGKNETEIFAIHPELCLERKQF